MAHDQPVEPSQDFSLQCPYDGRRMDKVEVGAFAIDRCPTCAGIWFDMAELQRFIAHRFPAAKIDSGPPRAGKHDHTGKTYACPRDKSQLILISDLNQPHIRYHACTVCGGIMLDAGELSDISEFTLAEKVKAFFRL